MRSNTETKDAEYCSYLGKDNLIHFSESLEQKDIIFIQYKKRQPERAPGINLLPVLFSELVARLCMPLPRARP